MVCRSLGFPAAAEALDHARFGPGSGRIWMDGLRFVTSREGVGYICKASNMTKDLLVVQLAV